MTDVIVLIGVRTDAPGIAPRIQAALELARPTGDPAGQPFAWAKAVDELTAEDVDRIAAIAGWDVVDRLGIARVTGEGPAS